MNRNRIIVGGLVAGAIVWLAGVVARAYVHRAVPGVPPDMDPAGLHVIRSFAIGLVSVLLYALIIPRQGSTRSTALTSGLLVFLAGVIFPPLATLSGGAYPSRAMLIYIVWNAVAIPFATVAGCALYRDDECKSIVNELEAQPIR